MERDIYVYNPHDWPYGPLSNNYIHYIQMNGSTWSTITNYIYSRLLNTPIYRAAIQSATTIGNTKKIDIEKRVQNVVAKIEGGGEAKFKGYGAPIYGGREYARKLYKEDIAKIREQVQKEVVYEKMGISDLFRYYDTMETNNIILAANKVAYRAALSQHANLRKLLVATGTRPLVYESENTVLGVNKRGEGQNYVGKILEELRQEYQTLERATPQDISDKILTIYRAHELLMNELKQFSDIKDYIGLSPAEIINKYILKYHSRELKGEAGTIPKIEQILENLGLYGNLKEHIYKMYEIGRFPWIKKELMAPGTLALEVRREGMPAAINEQRRKRSSIIFEQYVRALIRAKHKGIAPDSLELGVDKFIKDAPSPYKLAELQEHVVRLYDEGHLDPDLTKEIDALVDHIKIINLEPETKDIDSSEESIEEDIVPEVKTQSKWAVELVAPDERTHIVKKLNVKPTQSQAQKIVQTFLESEDGSRLASRPGGQSFLKGSSRVRISEIKVSDGPKGYWVAIARNRSGKDRLLLRSVTQPKEKTIRKLLSKDERKFGVDVFFVSKGDLIQDREMEFIPEIVEGAIAPQEPIKIGTDSEYNSLTPPAQNPIMVDGLLYPSVAMYTTVMLLSQTGIKVGNKKFVPAQFESFKVIRFDRKRNRYTSDIVSNRPQPEKDTMIFWYPKEADYSRGRPIEEARKLVMLDDKKFMTLAEAEQIYVLQRNQTYAGLTAILAMVSLRKKFADAFLQNVLVTTGTKNIIWGDTKDPILGIGTPEMPGQNLIGKMLVDIRNELNTTPRLITGTVVKVPNLLLEDTFTKNWVIKQLGDICRTVGRLKEYLKQLNLLEPVDSRFIRKVIEEFYSPCSTVSEITKNTALPVPEYFKMAVKNCFGMKLVFSRDFDDEIAKLENQIIHWDLVHYKGDDTGLEERVETGLSQLFSQAEKVLKTKMVVPSKPSRKVSAMWKGVDLFQKQIEKKWTDFMGELFRQKMDTATRKEKMLEKYEQLEAMIKKHYGMVVQPGIQAEESIHAADQRRRQVDLANLIRDRKAEMEAFEKNLENITQTYWNHMCVLVYFGMGKANENAERFRKMLVDMSSVSSKPRRCHVISLLDSRQNCIASALFNILLAIQKFKGVYASNIDLNFSEIDLAQNILLDRPVSQRKVGERMKSREGPAQGGPAQGGPAQEIEEQEDQDEQRVRDEAQEEADFLLEEEFERQDEEEDIEDDLPEPEDSIEEDYPQELDDGEDVDFGFGTTTPVLGHLQRDISALEGMIQTANLTQIDNLPSIAKYFMETIKNVESSRLPENIKTNRINFFANS